MEIWGGGYEKPELVSVAEQIHKLKSQKADLELELSEQKFKYRYIPQRKELAGEQLRNVVIAMIIIVIVMLGFLFCDLRMFAEEEATVLHSQEEGLILLVSFIIFSYGIYLEMIMFKQAYPLVKLLSKKKIDKNDIKNTIDEDNYKTKNKINLLEDEIIKLDKEIGALKQRQKEILEEKEHTEKILKEKGILYDKKTEKKEGGISLKDNGQLEAAEIAQLYEYFQKEEYYILEYTGQLEKELEHVNRELVNIDDEFERVKAKLLISGVAFIVIIFIQSQFTGILQTVTSLICLFFSFSYVFYLDKVCKRPILDYLIEHESKYTKEYAFRTNAIPVAEKRKEVMEQLKHSKNELDDLKKQMEILDIS